MARNQFQDIKKTDIKKDNNFSKKYVSTNFPRNDESIVKTTEEVSKNSPKYTLWVVALISVVFLFFALSFLFSSATVTIIPKIKSISLNQNISAVKETNVENLSFDLITLSDVESTTIQSGEEKDFKESAKGKVLLYNKYSQVPQQLLIDTRLEGSNGKIYKTKTKVTIPGMNKDGTPGKISVDIYALEPGAEYNSLPIDFKIFGFKGTNKYSKFYGRSVGEISGGLVGKSRQVTEEQKVAAEKELKALLEAKLFSKAISQIPVGFILFKDATLLNIDESNLSKTGEDGSVTLEIKGTLNGFIFNNDKLTKLIIQYLIPDYEGNDVYISNIKDLTISIPKKDEVVASEATKIDFNIYGVPKLVYKIDAENLAVSLVNKNKKDFNQILLKYPNIDSANLSIKPIWRSTFPEKIKNIKVIINYP
jgi:hypothetical protein